MPNILDLPVSTAAEITPEWIATVRETLEREGQAARRGPCHSIQVQSLRDGVFRPLQLPNGGRFFETADARDLIFDQLVPQKPTAPKP
jgi:hypothetical protein